MHASPFEHQACPMKIEKDWKNISGITHLDRQGNYWSNNFKGWVQHRSLME